jgi:hypothetical protein
VAAVELGAREVGVRRLRGGLDGLGELELEGEVEVGDGG